jgi:hypothetical protein
MVCLKLDGVPGELDGVPGSRSTCDLDANEVDVQMFDEGDTNSIRIIVCDKDADDQGGQKGIHQDWDERFESFQCVRIGFVFHGTFDYHKEDP